jgi:hypothetical protein
MVEAVRTSETSVDNHFTRQYNPEDNSEHHTRRRENLKSHMVFTDIFPVAAVAATVGLWWPLCINHTKKAVKFKYTLKLHQYFLI